MKLVQHGHAGDSSTWSITIFEWMTWLNDEICALSFTLVSRYSNYCSFDSFFLLFFFHLISDSAEWRTKGRLCSPPFPCIFSFFCQSHIDIFVDILKQKKEINLHTNTHTKLWHTIFFLANFNRKFIVHAINYWKGLCQLINFEQIFAFPFLFWSFA